MLFSLVEGNSDHQHQDRGLFLGEDKRDHFLDIAASQAAASRLGRPEGGHHLPQDKEPTAAAVVGIELVGSPVPEGDSLEGIPAEGIPVEGILAEGRLVDKLVPVWDKEQGRPGAEQDKVTFVRQCKMEAELELVLFQS